MAAITAIAAIEIARMIISVLLLWSFVEVFVVVGVGEGN